KAGQRFFLHDYRTLRFIGLGGEAAQHNPDSCVGQLLRIRINEVPYRKNTSYLAGQRLFCPPPSENHRAVSGVTCVLYGAVQEMTSPWAGQRLLYTVLVRTVL
ncbi:MAG: hypothetical protein ACO4CG_04550, partial [Prochlorothrix sp.]